MNKTLKKIIALVLSLIMILSVSSVSLSVFAQNEDIAVSADSQEEDNTEHTTFFQLFLNFVKEIYNFYKYIFYDVFLGRDVPDVPPMVHDPK